MMRWMDGWSWTGCCTIYAAVDESFQGPRSEVLKTPGRRTYRKRKSARSIFPLEGDLVIFPISERYKMDETPRKRGRLAD